MKITVFVCLIVVFFFTAVVSVVTGGTSLITVPVMMQCGVDPHVAVATNMLALIFLSLGGTLPFIKGQVLTRKRLPALSGLTVIGSLLGAFLLLVVPSKTMPIVIATAMIVVAVFPWSSRTPVSPHPLRRLPATWRLPAMWRPFCSACTAASSAVDTSPS